MSLSLHTLAPAKGARTHSFRVGRGNASGRGTTAGRGTKGQRACTGGRKNLKLKGLKQMLLAFPKMRGFQSMYIKPETVKLSLVAKAFAANEAVNLKSLKAKGLVGKTATEAKLVGGEEVGKALIVNGLTASATAKAAIEKAGGTFMKLKKNSASTKKGKKTAGSDTKHKK